VIVCVGLATRDTIYALPRHPEPDERVVATERIVAGGGPAATAAVAIARLGVEARFVGVIDGELDGVEVVPIPGRMVESTILVTPDARSIVTQEAAPFEAPRDALEGAEWLHVDHGGYAALPSRHFRLSIDGGNPIPKLDLDGVELYAPTEGMDDGRRAKLTVVTRGADGCTALVGDERIDVPGFRVDPVISTLGAGDVFHGALLACFARGLELRDALVHANACAALSCRALDGRSAIPSWDELTQAVANAA
jgi:sugar/nucleoside kinase (ribokinase family)